MAVIVTGATGHIGANLVRALLAQGRQVRALVHSDPRALTGLDVECIPGDIQDESSLRPAFSGIETVFHLASYISIQPDDWPLLQRINIDGTRNVIAACQACHVHRLVHFSSIEAYQKEPLDVELDEDRPLVDPSHHHSAYELSKAEGERLVRQAIQDGMDAIILNPTAVIGPYDFKPSHIGQVLVALMNHRLPALVSGGFNWVDARDVVAAALKAEICAPAGSRYLIAGHWVSVRELANTVARLTGASAPRLILPLHLAKLAAPLLVAMTHLAGRRPLFTSVSLEALDSNRFISSRRAVRDLAYQPRPFEETLTDTLHWFVDSGQLKPPPN